MYGLNMFMSFLIGVSSATSGAPINTPITISGVPFLATTTTSISAAPLHARPKVYIEAAVPDVPFYSQFEDIHEPAWKKVGCGVTSLAMIIEFYHPGMVSVDTLLHDAVASGAYIKGAGWSHQGLVAMGAQYGLEGRSYDLTGLDQAGAFARFEKLLAAGPVIASVHYKFDPKSTIPHLVVITGMREDRIYYNDPAGHAPGQSLSVTEFLQGWKKRFIVVRPV